MSNSIEPRPNPFPGLRPFRSDEHHLFFGREEQTAALLQLLRQNRFLAVVGTSGSGKSSLVRAGLIAELYSGTMTQAGSTWEVIILRPGGSPVENIARAMVEADLYDAEDPQTLPRLRATLSRSRFGLVEAVKQSDVFELNTNLLVVVDQFEELFRFRQQGVGSEEAAAAFVNLLLTASQQQERAIYVTITMRSDYLGDCSEIPGLAEAVNEGEYLIPRLQRDQKRDAIEKPIGVGGAKIDSMLVQRLLNDVGDDPDQLPVLQHALMRMWDVWSARHDPTRPIEFADFEATGGLAAALSHHADEIYESLADDKHRLVCERVFKTLTEKGSDNRGIRRPTRLSGLEAIAEADRVTITNVADAFRQSGVTFLMPGMEHELTDRTVLDLSHESLMRGWNRLRRWVEDEAQSARIFRRLSDTASLWRQGNAGLFRDPDLQIAQSWREQQQPNAEWAEQYGGNFETAIDFLEKSGAAASAEQRAQEAARQRELEQAKALANAERQRADDQKRAARRLSWLVGCLALVAVAAMIAFFMAQRAERMATLAKAEAEELRLKAEESRANAESSRVKAEQSQASAEQAAGKLKQTVVLGEFGRGSRMLEAGNANDSLSSFAMANRQDDTFWQAGTRALAVMTQRRLLTDKPEVLQQAKPITDWDIHPEAELAYTLDADSGGKDRQGVVWDLATGKQLYTFGDGEKKERVGFSKDGSLLFAGGDVIRGWHARTGESLGYQLDAKDMRDGSFRHVEVSDGGGRIVFASKDDHLQLWDRLTGKQVCPPLSAGRGLVDWADTPDGTKICALYRTGELAIWSTADGALVRQLSTLPIYGGSLQVSLDSRFVLVEDQAKKQVRWWRTEDASQDSEPAEWLTFAKPVTDVRFIKGKDFVVLISPALNNDEASRQECFVHDLTTGVSRAQISPTEPVTLGPFFANEHASIMGCVLDKKRVVIWDPETGKQISETAQTIDNIARVEFSPDGGRFLTASGENEDVRVWNTFSGAQIGEPIPLKGHLNQLFFGTEGERLFTTDFSAFDLIRIWDSRNGESLAEPFKLSSGTFEKTEFLDDGLRAVTEYSTLFNSGEVTQGDLTVWSSDTTKAIYTPLREAAEQIQQLDYSPDSHWVLVIGQDKGVRSGAAQFCEIWDADTREVVFSCRQAETLRFAAFDSSSKRVVVASNTNRATVWNIESGARVIDLPHERHVAWAKFSPDGTRILTACDGGAIHLWDLNGGTEVITPIYLGATAFATSGFGAAGDRIYLCSESGLLSIIDAQTGKSLLERNLVEANDAYGWRQLWAARFSEDFTHLVVHPAFSDEARVIAVSDGETIQSFHHEGEIVRTLDFSPTETLVVTGTGRNPNTPAGRVYLRDWKSGQPYNRPLELGAWAAKSVFSHDGRLLVTGTVFAGGSVVQLWDVATTTQVMDPIRVDGYVTHLVLQPDGQRVLVGSSKGDVQLIDLPPRETPVPNWLSLLAETIAGNRLNDLGAFEAVNRDEMITLRQQIQDTSASDPYRVWGEWILADRPTRTMAPGSPWRREQYVNHLTHTNEQKNLQAALRLAPKNALAHARFGYLLARSAELKKSENPPPRGPWMDVAQWYLHRATEIDADDAEVLAYQAEVWSQSGNESKAREAAQRAVTLDAHSANAQYLDAVTAAESGEWDNAQAAFARAIGQLAENAKDRHRYDTKSAPPLIGILDDLELDETWAGRRDVQLPSPIAGTFEDFESISEGRLPQGWRVENHTDEGDSAGRMDLNDFDSDAYKNWNVVSRERLQSIDDAASRLHVRPNQFVNGTPVRRLLDGNFLHAESARRQGAQVQILSTPDFDCSGQQGVHVAFYSSYEQDQDNLSALEYSVDQGQTWLPVVYRLDERHVVRDAQREIDAVATLNRPQFNAPRFRDIDGQWRGTTYGDFMAAAIDPGLAPFIQPGHAADPEEFKRVEVFRLPKADGQSTVRLRFLHAGSRSRFWSLDNVGLYAIEDGAEVFQTQPRPTQPIPVARAADPDRLLDRAAELIPGIDAGAYALDKPASEVAKLVEQSKPSDRDLVDVQLLTGWTLDQRPHDARALYLQARALGLAGAGEAALAMIDRAIEQRPETPAGWQARREIYQQLGEQFLTRDQRDQAVCCFEIASALTRGLDAKPDAYRKKQLNDHLVKLGRLKEPQVLVPRGSVWRYLDDGSDQGTAWSQPDFDDTAWPAGPAKLGYGDNDVVTTVGFGANARDKFITTYFRTAFNIAELGAQSELRVSLRRDDGAIVYLNGQEIVRSNMPTTVVQFDTWSSDIVDSNDEKRFFEFVVSASALRPGQNVVAVEVHQRDGTSSDIGFDLELAVIGINTTAYPEAAELEATAASLNIPREVDSLLWTSRASMFAAAGDRVRMDECLERAALLDPDDPEVPYVKARIAARLGDMDAAYEWYQDAIKRALALRQHALLSKRLLLSGVLKPLSQLSNDTPIGRAHAAAERATSDDEDVLWELELLDRWIVELAQDDPKVSAERVAILMRLGKFADALAVIESVEASVADTWWKTPASIEKHQQLLRQKERVYRVQRNAELADQVTRTYLYPPRPAELDDKLIDLSSYYNASLYDGRKWSRRLESNIARLPASFIPRKGVGFDLRGIIQLESAKLPDGKSVNEQVDADFPLEVAGIQINQSTSAIHFLTSCQWGEEVKGAVVAHFVMHYEDGTSDDFDVKFLDDVADWVPKSNPHVPARMIGWSGRNDAGSDIFLSELVWKNPHPEKTISHIDFVSAQAKAGPFLVGITLE